VPQLISSHTEPVGELPVSGTAAEFGRQFALRLFRGQQ
jgi:hypothetical protein